MYTYVLLSIQGHVCMRVYVMICMYTCVLVTFHLSMHLSTHFFVFVCVFCLCARVCACAVRGFRAAVSFPGTWACLPACKRH